MTPGQQHKTIVVVSTCFIDWGGSEELWGLAAAIMLKEGYRFILYKPEINRSHPRIKKLMDQGLKVEDLKSVFSKITRFLKYAGRGWRKIFRISRFAKAHKSYEEEGLQHTLKKYSPELVLIAQGINFDGLHYAKLCLDQNFPYVIISQKAVDFFWPSVHKRAYMKNVLQNAIACYFVSKHNLELTEEQFGVRLQNAEIVFNPVKIPGIIPYPNPAPLYRLACVARLFLLDKGQDILIRILSQEKWQSRPLKISFIGSGDDLEPLQQMANLLKVANIEFTGEADDMHKVWEEHHALILPSRSEGLALSVIEAMAAGRPVIITTAGGNAEWVEEGISGFIGAIDLKSFEEAMERAWLVRDHWKSIGEQAAATIRKNIPNQPEYDFVNRLQKLSHERI